MSEGKAIPDDIGYGKPPASTRFRKARAATRRAGRGAERNELPYEAVLGQMVTIREDGVERRVTAAEAFLLHMTKLGLEGDGPAARAAMAAIQEARAARGADGEEPLQVIIRVFVDAGSVSTGLTALRMATKLDRYRPTARIALEPWLVRKGARPIRGPAAVARGTGDGRESNPDAKQGTMAGLVGGGKMNLPTDTEPLIGFKIVSMRNNWLAKNPLGDANVKSLGFLRVSGQG